jgi:hypothetical protein
MCGRHLAAADFVITVRVKFRVPEKYADSFQRLHTCMMLGSQVRTFERKAQKMRVVPRMPRAAPAGGALRIKFDELRPQLSTNPHDNQDPPPP